MAAFGIGVLAQGIHKMVLGVLPNAETMGIIGALVLLGNGICFLLLFRHRADDLNMRLRGYARETISSLIWQC